MTFERQTLSIDRNGSSFLADQPLYGTDGVVGRDPDFEDIGNSSDNRFDEDLQARTPTF